MLKLGFDVDEVICLTLDKVLRYLKDTWDIELSRESVHFFEFHKHPALKQRYDVVADIHNQFNEMSLDFYKDCLPDVDGVKVIRQLNQQGHKIHFISSRPGGAEAKTAIWLRKHGIPFNSVKHVDKSANKGRVCKNLELDFYIDDHSVCLDSALSFKKSWPNGLLLLDKPWNKDYNNEKVLRVYNWNEVLHHLST